MLKSPYDCVQTTRRRGDPKRSPLYKKEKRSDRPRENRRGSQQLHLYTNVKTLAESLSSSSSLVLLSLLVQTSIKSHSN